MADKGTKQEITEKDAKRGKKEKRSYMITIRLITAVIIVLLVLFSAGGVAAEGEESMALSLYAINVGKADALLLRSGKTAYLIDTGTEDSWPALKKALLAEGVIKLDGVILTLFGFTVTMYMLNKALSTLLVMIWNYFTKRAILRGKIRFLKR